MGEKHEAHALARRDRERVRSLADPTVSRTLLEVVEEGAPAQADVWFAYYALTNCVLDIDLNGSG